MSDIFVTASRALCGAVEELYDLELDPKVEIPEEQFGDVASNVAMQLASQLGQNPREIAAQITKKLSDNPEFAAVTVEGPGFINITVKDAFLGEAMWTEGPHLFEGKKVVTEYSDPNPFKVLHAGHLYTSIVGDVISNLYEFNGADVSRVNFGGDIGLHVAKAMWGILDALGGEHPEKLSEIKETERSDWLSQCYVAGNAAYEEGGKQDHIVEINKRLYQIIDTDDHNSRFAQIYWICRQWSYDYFDAFYKRIGTPFEKYYPESETAPVGLDTVQRELANGVYEKSDGAVIFDGEKHGLHKRVFINSEGLPTYEAKDIGLAMMKWQDYQFDRNIIITGSDIIEYMKVVLKSIEQFEPEIAKRTIHVTHGMVKLKGGVKMSSRLGNFLKATDILDATIEATDNADDNIVLAAVKYSFLRHSIGQDVIFDPQESVSTHGNSGPYLQYAHARARSILANADGHTDRVAADSFEPGERTLARKLSTYNAAISKATLELAPHHLCTYLFELSQVFNKFYEDNKVVGHERQAIRLKLVEVYADRLREGLNLLGIKAPDRI